MARRTLFIQNACVPLPTRESKCQSSYANTMSSAVNGWPSDHCAPSRRVMVRLRKSGANSKPLARLGTTVVSARM